MANDIEYQSQRPSCEYFIGLARGKGIEVYVPPESDLLKCMYLYGFEDGELSTMSAKFDAYIHEQQAGIGAAQQQLNEAMAQMQQRIGAKNCADYFKTRFCFPNTNFVAERLKER
jgi:hypothetical protein